MVAPGRPASDVRCGAPEHTGRSARTPHWVRQDPRGPPYRGVAARTLGQRVAYACPTKQLARQVLQKAHNQGIRAVLLIGSHRNWNQAELARYTRGDAVAVTTYSTIFNVNPYLDDAQTLVFDDAHAAEGYVAEAWALSVKSDAANTGSYSMRSATPSSRPSSHGWSRLTGRQQIRRRSGLSRSGRSHGTPRILTGYWPGFRAMPPTGSECCVPTWPHASSTCRGVSSTSGPMIPPTFEHDPFTNPEQRLYLSATLGDAGELERAFGRTGIKRVPVPPAWDKTGSGRRFFVFPELAAPPIKAPAADDNADEEEAAPQAPGPRPARPGQEATGADTGRRFRHAIADWLDIPAGERFTAKDSDTGIQPFIDADTGTLLAPNRYDGMDLADNACRMMLMAGLPTASHLQDQFLETKLRASEVLQERIRTRVLQGRRTVHPRPERLGSCGGYRRGYPPLSVAG